MTDEIRMSLARRLGRLAGSISLVVAFVFPWGYQAGADLEKTGMVHVVRHSHSIWDPVTGARLLDPSFWPIFIAAVLLVFTSVFARRTGKTGNAVSVLTTLALMLLVLGWVLPYSELRNPEWPAFLGLAAAVVLSLDFLFTTVRDIARPRIAAARVRWP
jgi:hypothetical protein